MEFISRANHIARQTGGPLYPRCGTRTVGRTFSAYRPHGWRYLPLRSNISRQPSRRSGIRSLRDQINHIVPYSGLSPAPESNARPQKERVAMQDLYLYAKRAVSNIYILMGKYAFATVGENKSWAADQRTVAITKPARRASCFHTVIPSRKARPKQIPPKNSSARSVWCSLSFWGLSTSST